LGTPLVDRDACADAIAAFLDHVAADETLPNRLLLSWLNESGPVAQALRSALACRGGAFVPFDQHQRALLRPQAQRDGYVERAMSPKRRKKLLRQRHRLGDIGPLSFTIATAAGEVASALQDFLALEAGGWKGRAGTAIAQQPDIAHFASNAVASLAANGQARIASLCCRSRPIASALTLMSGNGAWVWKIAYDESFASGSPGVQVCLDLTETLLAEPAVAFVDSCATPDHPMIDHMWRERLDMADWLITLAPGAVFDLVRRLEAARRRAVALARQWRNRIDRTQ
jgi:hypothetical protein